jgi:V/A-type H+-transporting ATPase subunit D
MELLKLRAKKKLAKKGHDLLKKKRDTLIKEFFVLIKEYKELKQQMLTELHGAFEVLHIAQAVSGVNRVKGLAYSAEPTCTIAVETKNLMGVKVPKFTIQKIENATINASMIGSSYYVEKAREQFTRLLPAMIKFAETEQVIYTLAEEIKKTKRRVNALEFIKIPEMEQQEMIIKTQLAEVERESFGRLKNVKRKIEKKVRTQR